jgi:hypothetical protein
MNAGIRDKVTDQIFRAKLMGQGEGQPRRRSNYRVLATSHAEDAGYGVSETVAAAATTESNGEQGPVATSSSSATRPRSAATTPAPAAAARSTRSATGPARREATSESMNRGSPCGRPSGS